jgi:hypothetical protein
MKLLLITGAGASRNLNARDSKPIALMDEWASVLTHRFGPEVSKIIGLDAVTTAQEFEELLGELTRWLQLKDLNLRFAPMLSDRDRYDARKVQFFRHSLEVAERRGEALEVALDETLVEEFGLSRFDAEAAAKAYDYLLRQIHKGRPEELICATTNYDRSLELALRAIKYRARTGFYHDGVAVPRFSPAGLGTFGDMPAILHLHGAVGWYRDAHGILEVPLADSNHPEIGRPAVLYPSKNKIIEESSVAAIWAELDRALDDATHIFVLGHGLGDDHLVARLEGVTVPLAVTAHRTVDADRIRDSLSHAHVVKTTFASKPKIDTEAIKGWLTN